MRRMSGKPQQPVANRATLQMPRAEAEERLKAQIKKGQELLLLPGGNVEQLETVKGKIARWLDFTVELLRRMVDTDDLVDELEPEAYTFVIGPLSPAAEVRGLQSAAKDRVAELESILGRLELIPESPPTVKKTNVQPALGFVEVSRRVFVVHGHDTEAKESVARCLEKLDLEAVILHEQPNQGRTIIEKFEDYADVGFAVVLLTPDDAGAPRDGIDNLRPRARQNVILELGFFLGRLGRQRVCALHKGDMEIPSDFARVLWVPMDPGGAWRLALTVELKAAGLEVDLNRLA